MSFEKFLSFISSAEVKKIWVDFKNLAGTNAKDALARLNYLDERFNLKGKLIIESESTGEFFRKLFNSSRISSNVSNDFDSGKSSVVAPDSQ